jgi:predicted transcriptional regulator
LRAIRTPLRQEILRSIVGLGPVSVRELAGVLDRQPASLYYHVHALEQAGLIVRDGQHHLGGRAENTYTAVADRILVDRTARSPSFARALVDLHRAALSQADREIENAVRREQLGETPEGEGVVLLRLTASLSKRDAREARQRLHELAQFLGEKNSTEGKETLSLTAALVSLS